MRTDHPDNPWNPYRGRGRSEQGLPERCVISCDNVITVPIEDLEDEPVGRLDEVKRAALDIALRFALDIVY